MKTQVSMYLYGAWFTSLCASVASVIFIEVLGNQSATLCWVERMLMFGLFLILTVGIVYRDTRVKRFAFPFLLIGVPMSFFQQLIHWNIIKLAPQACGEGFVCTTKFFELFGFVTQATLCLAAFLIVGFCLFKLRENK